MSPRRLTEAEFDALMKRLMDTYRFEADEEERKSYAYYIEYHKNRFLETLNAVPSEDRALKVFDVGLNHDLLAIREVYPHYSYSGVDLTDRLIDVFRKLNIKLKICDITREPIPYPDGEFDLVIFTEVLEHLCAPYKTTMNGLHRILKDGGKLIFSVPNIATMTRRLKFLMGVNPTSWEMNETLPHGHLHEFTMNEASALLESCGFSITRRRYVDNCRRSNTSIPKSDRPRLALLPSFRQTLFFECVARKT
ncbi:MAG: methyltransferase domain-containing protein [Euryarchaeota archaeon]|nr:methyltransferase domain-containing protein [Euryarchaeota archaeon]